MMKTVMAMEMEEEMEEMGEFH
jgi:hypothetical protein